MKKILFTIIALCSTLSVGAQNELETAVLQHNGETKIFTGRDAFVNANAVAVDGDVITLSVGTFNIADITKSISLYGAGFEENEETGTHITAFSDVLKIGVSGETLANVHIEGILLNGISAVGPLDGLVLNKCGATSDITLVANSNTTISNCALYTLQSNSAVTTNCLIKNCHFKGVVYEFGGGSTITMDHCIALWYVGSFTCTNSIFIFSDAFSKTSGATVTNCIVRNLENNRPEDNTFTNCYVVGNSDIFTNNDTFELVNPELWVGTDGQEVGIRYGWSKVPSSVAVKNATTTVSGNNLNVNYTK